MMHLSKFAVIACLLMLTASWTSAQNFPPPPPNGMQGPIFPAPVPGPVAIFPPIPNPGCAPPFMCFEDPNRLYRVSAGVRWRRVYVNFAPDTQGISTNTNITVPFGPTTPGNVNYTGGVWTYWNGSFINSFNPQATVRDIEWTTGSGPLGHNNVTLPNQNVGSFGIIDPVNQGVTPGQLFSNIQTVSFRLNNVASTISLNAAGGDSQSSKDVDVWFPYLEFSYQYSNAYDVLLGLSGFGFNKSYGRRVGYNFQGTITNAVDTFTFISNNNAQAMPTPFLSTAIGGAGQPVEGLYQIDPASGTRSFVTATVRSASLGSLQDSLFSKIDGTLYEIRSGVRTRYLLNQSWRFTVAGGPLFAWIPYNITTSTSLTSTNDVVDPGTGQVIFPANTVFRRGSKTESGTWFNFGGFASIGLELGMDRWFVLPECGYDGYFLSSHNSVNGMDTTFYPSGWSVSLGGGVRF